ncbi:MAG: hypothetical protein ACJ70O_01845 [Nitrososphaera sp.]
MVTEEQLKCNICGGITVSSSQAEQHASTSAHESNKSKLEQALDAVRVKNYPDDRSVVASWETSSV